MPLYQVLVRPDPASIYAGESGAVFIAEKFSWWAMLFPPLWALVHGLWLELLFYIAFVMVLYAGAAFAGEDAAILTYVLGAVFIGFAAPGIHVRGLLRKGYARLGDVVAPGPEYAEAEYVRARMAA